MQEEISFGLWLRKQRRALDLSGQAFAIQVALQSIEFIIRKINHFDYLGLSLVSTWIPCCIAQMPAIRRVRTPTFV